MRGPTLEVAPGANTPEEGIAHMLEEVEVVCKHIQAEEQLVMSGRESGWYRRPLGQGKDQSPPE